MNKSNSYLKIPGLNTPRLFVFLHGFANGRCKTAEIDRESGVVTSAFLIAKSHLFDRFTRNYATYLEKCLHKKRVIAEKLLLEYDETQSRLADLDVVSEETPSNGCPGDCFDEHEQRREAEAKEEIMTKRQKYEEKCFQILLGLGELRADLNSEERVAEEKIRATAHTLQEQFAVYVHGALLSAVYRAHVPVIIFEDYLDGYHNDHARLMRRLDETLDVKMLKEVQ